MNTKTYLSTLIPTLRSLDHMTFPVSDNASAEFYKPSLIKMEEILGRDGLRIHPKSS